MRPHVLVIYPFEEAALERCASLLASAIGGAGAHIELADARRPPDATAYDAVVLGVPPGRRACLRTMEIFVRENGVSLAAIPFAVFTVDGSASGHLRQAAHARFAALADEVFAVAPEAIRVFQVDCSRPAQERDVLDWGLALGFHVLGADAACPFSSRSDDAPATPR